MATTFRRSLEGSLFLGVILILMYKIQPTMFSRTSGLFAVVLPAAAHAAVDLSWHAPAQTSYNNITAAFGSDGVYGFIFNTSNTPEDEYGTYNWCNMPHVRKTEYVRPSDEYKLKYVEVVSRISNRYLSNSLLKPTRFIDITSALRMPAMHSLSSLITGTVTVRGCTITDNTCQPTAVMGPQRAHTGTGITRRSIRLCPRAGLARVNSHRSHLAVWTTHGFMAPICTACTMIFLVSCLTTPPTGGAKSSIV